MMHLSGHGGRDARGNGRSWPIGCPSAVVGIDAAKPANKHTRWARSHESRSRRLKSAAGASHAVEQNLRSLQQAAAVLIVQRRATYSSCKECKASYAAVGIARSGRLPPRRWLAQRPDKKSRRTRLQLPAYHTYPHVSTRIHTQTFHT